MRPLALLILLLAAAAPVRPATAGVEVAHATRPADPPRSQDPARGWTPSLRASVMRHCQASLPDGTNCTCFTHQLEALSADSEVVTAENIQAALKVCRPA